MHPLARRSAALLLVAGAALLLGAPPAAAQAVEWAARHNGGFVDADACPGSCLELTAKRSLAVDPAGNIYVTGNAKTPAEEFRTIKYSPSGQVIWSVGFDGSGQYTGRAVAIAVDATGNAYVTGIVGGDNSNDFLTVKYATTDGHVEWQRRYDGPEHYADTPAAIGLDAAGNVFVTGTAQGYSSSEIRTLKYRASDGAELWSVGFPAASPVPFALAVDSSGNVVVAGTAAGDFLTIKYQGADGSVAWTRSYSSPGSYADEAHAVAVDGSGNVIVAGRAFNGVSVGFRTIKYAAADGSELWSVAHAGAMGGAAEPYAVAVDGLGNAYVTGSSAGPGTFDYRTVKLVAADGSTVWDVAYDGPDHDVDMAWAVAVDGSGNACVTGYSGTATGNQYGTVKYASADGSVIWSSRFDAPGVNDNRAAAVAVDAAGDVVVTGSSYDGRQRDFHTLKYAGATGAELFDVPDGVLAGIEDKALHRGLKIDGSGAVVATGTSWSTHYMMAAAKYSSAGSQLWAAAYDSPAQQGSQARGAALDPAGNVFLAGSSTGPSTGTDFRTIKLAAADGALLWTASHDGSAHGDDSVSAVAAGPGGDVFVTGAERSSSGFSNDDWRTIRYSGSGGAVVWSVAYDSGQSDFPLALALDGPGNAYVLGQIADRGNSRLTKYAAADGAIVWSRLVEMWSQVVGPGAHYLAVDGAGDAYVLGVTSNAHDDTRLVKYSGATGDELWHSDLNAVPGDDVPWALTVDSLGHVYAVGHTDSGVSVAKYLGSDGSLLWNVPVAGFWSAAQVEADPNGDLYLAGSYLDGDSWDFVTARLAASDGRTLWNVRYGLANSSDEAVAVAATVGAAYVMGASYAPQTGYDILTVKYVLDSVAPLAPTAIWSTTHAPGSWRNVSAIGTSWSGAVDPVPASGLAGYSVLFDSSAGTVPDTTVEVPQTTDPHGTTSAALPDGQGYYFHVRACDHGGNCSAAVHAGPYAIDTTAPLAPASVASSSHVPGVPSNVTTLALQWTSAVDPPSNGVASGIDGYGWFLDDETSAACSGQKVAEEWTTSVSVPVSLGTWYAHVCARDNAGNWSGVATAGPYLIGDPADLSVTLGDDADPIHVRGTVTYTATYANAGPSSAPGTTLVFTLPAGLQFVSSVPGEPACSGDGQTLKCALGELSSSAGGTVTVTAQALPRTKGLQTVSAKVRAEASDTDLSDNTALQGTLVKFVKGDLQDDWATDLYLRNVTTGENVAWLMNGTTRLSEAPIEPAAPQYPTQQVSGVDDFDGDGRNDLAFWDNTTGAVEFWLMDGATRPGDPVELSGGSQPPPWRLAATADFDRDGWPDLLWRNESTQKLVVWTLNGTAKKGELVPSPDQAVHANWQVVGAVDLNGDGNVDLLWYNVSTGKIVYWWLDGSLQRITGSFTNPPNAGDANWKVLATGDYGAGPGGVADTADLVWRNETSGKYVVWHLDLAGNRTAGTFTTPDAPTNPTDWTIAGPR